MITSAQIAQATKEWLAKDNAITQLPVRTGLYIDCYWCSNPFIPDLKADKFRIHSKLCNICSKQYQKQITTSDMLYCRRVSSINYRERCRLLFDQGIQGQEAQA